MPTYQYHPNGLLEPTVTIAPDRTTIKLAGSHIEAIAGGPITVEIQGNELQVTQQNGIPFAPMGYEVARNADGSVKSITFPAADGKQPSAITLQPGEPLSINIAASSAPETWRFKQTGDYTITRANHTTTVNPNGSFTRVGSYQEMRRGILYTLSEETRGTNYNGPGISVTTTTLKAPSIGPERTTIISERLPSGDVRNLEVITNTSRTLITDVNDDSKPETIAIECRTAAPLLKMLSMESGSVTALKSTDHGRLINLPLTLEQALAAERDLLTTVSKTLESANLPGIALGDLAAGNCQLPQTTIKSFGLAARE